MTSPTPITQRAVPMLSDEDPATRRPEPSYTAADLEGHRWMFLQPGEPERPDRSP
jgi:hypothetical protein